MQRLTIATSVFLTLALACAGCGSARMGTAIESLGEGDAEIALSDRQGQESRTIVALAKLEKSLDEYLQKEGKIPSDLETLVPKYTSGIVTLDTGLAAHKPSNKVAYYPPEVIRDGFVDGTKLRDTGGWGYVHNERQIIVFVDCTHRNSRNRAWYQERGVN